MTRTTKDLLKVSLASALLVILIGLAGREDYNDAVISEMQNNGAYTRYADAHPTLTDAELVKLYLQDRDK